MKLSHYHYRATSLTFVFGKKICFGSKGSLFSLCYPLYYFSLSPSHLQGHHCRHRRTTGLMIATQQKGETIWELLSMVSVAQSTYYNSNGTKNNF